MLLVGIAVLMWSREAFAPAPQEWVLKPVPSVSRMSWVNVLERIDSSRNRAVELRGVAANGVEVDATTALKPAVLLAVAVEHPPRRSASRRICVDLPEPSPPSKVMKCAAI